LRRERPEGLLLCCERVYVEGLGMVEEEEEKSLALPKAVYKAVEET
jgi:hypothetical protein